MASMFALGVAFTILQHSSNVCVLVISVKNITLHGQHAPRLCNRTFRLFHFDDLSKVNLFFDVMIIIVPSLSPLSSLSVSVSVSVSVSLSLSFSPSLSPPPPLSLPHTHTRTHAHTHTHTHTHTPFHSLTPAPIGMEVSPTTLYLLGSHWKSKKN